MKKRPKSLLHNATVSLQFGPRADDYLKSSTHATGEDLNRLEEITDGKINATVLDMGCGGGHVSYAVAPYVKKVIAFDLAPEMLEVVSKEAVKRDIRNIEISQGDIESLPYADESFDFVFSRFSAHHWLELTSGIKEAGRVLKSDGKAVFIDVLSPPSAKMDTYLQAVEILRDISHVRDYTVKEWQEALTSCRLHMQKQSTLKLRLDFLPWIQRMGTPGNRIDAIIDLQEWAPKQVRQYFAIEPDHSFTVDVGIFEVIKA